MDLIKLNQILISELVINMIGLGIEFSLKYNLSFREGLD